MNKKMKPCLTSHNLMHVLFGLGLGIFLVNLFPVLNVFLLGVVLMVIAFALDYRKK